MDDERDKQQARRRWQSMIADADQDERDQLIHGPRTRLVNQPEGPLVLDVGVFTTHADNGAIQKEQDRWTRLERMGR